MFSGRLLYFKDKKTPQKERFVYNRGALRGKKKECTFETKGTLFFDAIPR